MHARVNELSQNPHFFSIWRRQLSPVRCPLSMLARANVSYLSLTSTVTGLWNDEPCSHADLFDIRHTWLEKVQWNRRKTFKNHFIVSRAKPAIIHIHLLLLLVLLVIGTRETKHSIGISCVPPRDWWLVGVFTVFESFIPKHFVCVSISSHCY